jgi:hypothetical protein|tara:strand:- start:98 stop:352 length:255 start_codon:yes stop_codon:yes gene_type:complete
MMFLKICKIFVILFFLLIQTSIAFSSTPRSKFYDFRDQLIDGEVKKPVTLYTDAREKVKFERLLRLKKSFMNKLFDTAKERVFK